MDKKSAAAVSGPTADRTAPGPHPQARAAAPRPRVYYLDNIRIALTMLVVLHHVGVTYGNIPRWYYAEPAQDPTGGLLDLLVVMNQAYFMGFFFLISGFFVPGSHDRRGSRPFLGGRLLRLGVPLLLFVLLMRPVLNLPDYIDNPAGLPFWRVFLNNWGTGPMWFVETLLVFSLVYVLIRRIRAPRATGAPQRAGAAPPRAWTKGLLPVAGFTVLLIAATYLWRIPVPMNTSWPVTGLPSPAYMPQYALLFTVGILAFRNGWLNLLEGIPRTAGWATLAFAGVSGVAYFPALVFWGVGTGPGSWQTLATAAVECSFAVSMIIAVLWLFQRWFNRRGAFGRFLADRAYGVYFLHPLVLVGLSHALSWWEAPAIAKFAAVGALALPLCWSASHLLRLAPGAKRVF
ncbi:acyltransferase [Streptomonospora sediminis]